MSPEYCAQHSVRVRIADDAESLTRVHRLREEVFINELGYDIVGSFHESGETARAHAKGMLLLAEMGDVPVGTMAIDWWIGCDAHAEDIRHFQLAAFLDGFGEDAIVTVRKWLVRDAFRSLKVCKALLRAAVTFVEDKPSVQFVCIDCLDTLVEHYHNLGFRQYAEAFHYGDGGARCIPMCLVLDDHCWLSTIRSPLLPLLKVIGRKDNPAARACLERIIRDWRNKDTSTHVATMS